MINSVLSQQLSAKELYFKANNVQKISQESAQLSHPTLPKVEDLFSGKWSSEKHYLNNSKFISNNSYTVNDAEKLSEIMSSMEGRDFGGLKFINPESDEHFGGKMFWDTVKHDISALWNPFMDNSQTKKESSSNLGNVVESLASRYVSVRQRLNSVFSGQQNELSKQLDTLDNVFDAEIKNIAKKAGNFIGGKLGNSTQFENAVQKAFRNQSNSYYDFANKNPFYADQKLSGKEILKKDTMLMASILRDTYTELTQETNYLLQDLKAASDIAKMWDNNFFGYSLGIDGASHGLVAGVQSIKADQIMDKYSSSQSLRELVYDKINKDLDNTISNNEKNANSMRPLNEKITIDRQMAKDMLEYVRKTWVNTNNNIEETLKRSGATLLSPYVDKNNRNLSGFAKNFFSIDLSNHISKNYSSSYYDKLLTNWKNTRAYPVIDKMEEMI